MPTTPIGRKRPVNCSDHIYEPVMVQLKQTKESVRLKAPVVKISDTDTVPVADSDDSLDAGDRWKNRLTLDNDIVLPLDGRIEDNEMEGRNLGDQTIDTMDGDFEETAQEAQIRIEERFKNVSTPGADSRTEGEINTSQVDSSVMEELPLRRGAREFFKNQTGKIKSRFKGMQKPTFTKSKQEKSEKQNKSSLSASSTPKVEKASRIERFRMALPERPRISLPNKSKFRLPDRSKIHIKRPSFHLPESLSRSRKSKSDSLSQSKQSDTESHRTSRSIFDFSTLPRPKFFERRKKIPEYMTSTPKEERSIEHSTFPRMKKKSRLSLSARWAQRFGETEQHPGDESHVLERVTPWRHPSLEQPRLSLKPQTSQEGDLEKIPWENGSNRIYDLDVDNHSRVVSETGSNILREEHQTLSLDKEQTEHHILSSDKEPLKDPAMYDDEMLERIKAEELKKTARIIEDNSGISNQNKIQECHSPLRLDRKAFRRQSNSVEISDDDVSSMRSDKEMQQSSGSSCERRRRGVVDDHDVDVDIPPEGNHFEKPRFRFISEIRDALKNKKSQLIEEHNRLKKGLKDRRKERSLEASQTPPPEKPTRSRSTSRINKREDSMGRASTERHMVVYQTSLTQQIKDEEGDSLDNTIIKPQRRKSRGSLKLQHRASAPEQNILFAQIEPSQAVPPVPYRRKRFHRGDHNSSLSIRTCDELVCNGFAVVRISREPSQEKLPTVTPLSASSGITNMEQDQKMLSYETEKQMEVVPVAPKRRSRSRATSVVQDDDRTSRGAESLPELAFVEYDVTPPSSREPSLPGYAIVERRDKQPKPPPPRRKRQPSSRFASRMKRNSSPAASSMSSIPFVDDMTENTDASRELTSGEILYKMRDRPLPAPPRPPRAKRDRRLFRDVTPDYSETAASTQTDPFPDQSAIDELEEEVTRAKLVVTPTRSGSQVFLVTERISTPTPPIPPLPNKQRELDRLDRNRDRLSEPAVQLNALRNALFATDEPIKLANLEVSDLKVDRLSVSQLDAYKIVSTEIDAIVISAAELQKKSEADGSLPPSILQELISIRSQLESVASRSRPTSAMEDAYTATSNEEVNLCSQIQNTREEGKSYIRPFVREASPSLLSVQKSATDHEATVEMGRTVFPSSPSPDRTMTTDSTSNTITSVRTNEPTAEPPITERIVRQTSRSRSSSPGVSGVVRQTASPVKSLPPVISVTPDSPDTLLKHTTTNGAKPQRAVLSFSSKTDDNSSSTKETSPSPSLIRETSQSPTSFRDGSISPTQQSTTTSSAPQNVTQFIAFPTSQIPSEFFSLSNPISSTSASAPIADNHENVEIETNFMEMSWQLLRALKNSSSRSLRNFFDSVVSRFGCEDSDKIRQVELALCALLILIAGLIIVAICTPRTVTHHHHWDYFNPPQ